MSKKKKKKKSKEIAPHIKTFALKQKLDIKLFDTDIVIYQCDRQEKPNEFHKDKFEPKSVIVGVVETTNHLDRIAQVVKELDCGVIDIICLFQGDLKIDKYLNGDF